MEDSGERKDEPRKDVLNLLVYLIEDGSNCEAPN
jgi:hypothetical protein